MVNALSQRKTFLGKGWFPNTNELGMSHIARDNHSLVGARVVNYRSKWGILGAPGMVRIMDVGLA